MLYPLNIFISGSSRVASEIVYSRMPLVTVLIWGLWTFKEGVTMEYPATMTGENYANFPGPKALMTCLVTLNQ